MLVVHWCQLQASNELKEMPYKLNRPPRDLAKVKCVKKKKDKNGDVHYDLVVMFDHVSALKLFQKRYGATYIFWILGSF